MPKTPPKPAQDPSRLIDKEAMFKKIMPSAARAPASPPDRPTARPQKAAIPRLPVIAAAPAAPTAPVTPPPMLDQTENAALFADNLFADDCDFGDLGAEVLAPEAPARSSAACEASDFTPEPEPGETSCELSDYAQDPSSFYNNQDHTGPYADAAPCRQPAPYPIQPPQPAPVQQQQMPMQQQQIPMQQQQMPMQQQQIPMQQQQIPMQPVPVAPAEPAWSEDALVAVNLVEQIVFQRVDEVIRRVRGCNCEQCRTDLAALSLNKLPPQYVLAGEVRAEQLLSRKLVAQAVTSMMQSAFYVKLHPRHEP